MTGRGKLTMSEVRSIEAPPKDGFGAAVQEVPSASGAVEQSRAVQSRAEQSSALRCSAMHRSCTATAAPRRHCRGCSGGNRPPVRLRSGSQEDSAAGAPGGLGCNDVVVEAFLLIIVAICPAECVLDRKNVKYSCVF
jgi:hypothetical protein